jgi:hypothetical protein
MEIPLRSTLPRREQQLALLREMAGSLSQAKAAVLSSDLAEFESQTARQRSLCQQWNALLAHPAPDAGGDLLPELTMAASEVRQRLRLHSALLRRARRTNGIFCRVLATSGATYVVPPCPSRLRPATELQERV